MVADYRHMQKKTGYILFLPNTSIFNEKSFFEKNTAV